MRRITGIFHTAAVQMAVIVGLAMHCARGLFMLYGEGLNNSAQLAYSTLAYDAFTAAG